MSLEGNKVAGMHETRTGAIYHQYSAGTMIRTITFTSIQSEQLLQNSYSNVYVGGLARSATQYKVLLQVYLPPIPESLRQDRIAESTSAPVLTSPSTSPRVQPPAMMSTCRHLLSILNRTTEEAYPNASPIFASSIIILLLLPSLFNAYFDVETIFGVYSAARCIQCCVVKIVEIARATLVSGTRVSQAFIMAMMIKMTIHGS
jgi:hypothetical protein